jgi:hypothetical protein
MDEKLLVSEVVPHYHGNRELILMYSIVENNQVVDYHTDRELCQFLRSAARYLINCLSNVRYWFIFPAILCLVLNLASLSLRANYVIYFVVLTWFNADIFFAYQTCANSQWSCSRMNGWDCGSSLVGKEGSNPTDGIEVCLLWLCVFRQRFLLGAGHSPRRVLPSVVCLGVIVKPW